MRRARLFSVLALAAILLFTLESGNNATQASVPHVFDSHEYELLRKAFDLFHEVFDPLQREALPQKDFRRLRLMASQLAARGKSIVKLGVPQSINADQPAFAKALRRFETALIRFKNHAKTGSNSEVKKSFIAIDASFDRLEEEMARAYPGGLPPVPSLNCPATNVKAGSELSLTVDFVDGEFTFLWTIGTAKILRGQGTRMVTIDTTGLAGQTIAVSVEVQDGSGHAVMTSCEVQILRE